MKFEPSLPSRSPQLAPLLMTAVPALYLVAAYAEFHGTEGGFPASDEARALSRIQFKLRRGRARCATTARHEASESIAEDLYKWVWHGRKVAQLESAIVPITAMPRSKIEPGRSVRARPPAGQQQPEVGAIDAHGHERGNHSGCGLHYSISMTGSGVQLGQGPQALSR